MKDEKTGDDLVSIGFVIDLEYADATTSAHDLLQQFKTHPLVRGILEGGERVAWGAKALPGGGYWSMPKLSMPGARAGRRRRRHGRHGRAEGRSPRVNVGQARGASRSTRRWCAASHPSSPTSRRSRTRSSGKELYEVRNTRQPFQKGFIQGGPLSESRRSAQRGASRAVAGPGIATTPSRCSSASTKDNYPKPDGKYIFDKLSSVFITGNATRDDAPNHIRVQKHVPREIAETWRWMCPAGVYEIPEDAPEHGRGRRDRQLHQLRAVRRDHRQGRTPDDARGWRRAALPDPLSDAVSPRAARNICAQAGVRGLSWTAATSPLHRSATAQPRARRAGEPARRAGGRSARQRTCRGPGPARRRDVALQQRDRCPRAAALGDARRMRQRRRAGRARRDVLGRNELRSRARRGWRCASTWRSAPGDGEFHLVTAPGLGVWRRRTRRSRSTSTSSRSRTSRRRPPTAASCASAGSSAKGHVIKRAERLTGRCVQPAPEAEPNRRRRHGRADSGSPLASAGADDARTVRPSARVGSYRLPGSAPSLE